MYAEVGGRHRIPFRRRSRYGSGFAGQICGLSSRSADTIADAAGQVEWRDRGVIPSFTHRCSPYILFFGARGGKLQVMISERKAN